MKSALSPLAPLAVAVAAALMGPSCGARSELLPEQEPCAALGEVRSCANACGVGTQRCELGVWGDCEVAPSQRECRTACGAGTQECRDGEWLACKTPEVSRPCADACGPGVEVCRGGSWQRCEVPTVRVRCESVCGGGEEICERGNWRACNAPQPKPPKLFSVVRDFNDTHPDFELAVGGNNVELGLVQFLLGMDDKPVYANRAGSVTTSGEFNFNQWYRDVPAVNASTVIDLQFAPSPDRPGLFIYQDLEFFPIDGQLLGNQGRSHNYHFTLEASTRFQYRGGEVFRFEGDDDMWVFINRRLAIDLGGIHAQISRTVDLNAEASRLALTIGETYPLHFFFAERKTIHSRFTIETSISELGSCE